jgi:hypothetical protein
VFQITFERVANVTGKSVTTTGERLRLGRDVTESMHAIEMKIAAALISIIQHDVRSLD